MKNSKSNNDHTLNKGIEFQVVGIGASAGGLDAFKEFTSHLSETPGMAFILMQHLDPAYETGLSDILQRETKLPVLNLTEDVKLEMNHIYIVPSNKLLVYKDDQLKLELRPGKTQPAYSIDIFLTALAEAFQSRSIGILLSGMGTDGTLGLKAIKEYGGVTMVQIPSQARYDGMPTNAINSQTVDFEYAAGEMPKQLIKINETLKTLPDDENAVTNTVEEEYYKKIINLLRTRHDVDFTHYKQTTIRRRILRRMLVNKSERLEDYFILLKKNKLEQELLYQDLLIPVTSFFRDGTIFESLCTKIFPSMMEAKITTIPIRIWVAGCSTGEEAYSMGICLHEFLGDSIVGFKVQLFATDISEKAIQKARTGMYSKRELDGVSETRLNNYFIKIDGSYQVKKNIRDLCVFATHNFLKDPPFAKMDLISCRNVLIYMQPYLQKKALSTFHYALNEQGILLLGKSETAGTGSDLFKVVGKHEKLYSKKPLSGPAIRILPERSGRPPRQVTKDMLTPTIKKEDFHKNADDVLLSKYVPAGVIVNEQSEIVEFRGSTGAFLEALPGRPSLNILKMAREGLSFEIRNALHKARETREPVIKKYIPIQHGNKKVSIEIVPLLQTIEPYYLILFKEEEITELPQQGGDNSKGEPKDSPAQRRIQQLEKDLAQLREDMRTITEDQEAANEELQSANEELLSGSEELQSMNEEMETSKEELQSTNEELMTVNQELYTRNEQYNQARLYAEAIIGTIREPLLVLNRDLRIKSANNSFYQFFDLTEHKITGKILFELQESKWDIPELRTQILKIQTGQLSQLEWEVEFLLPKLGTRTIFLNAQPVNPESGEQLILLAFEDITLRKKEAQRLIDSAETLQQELNMMENFFIQAPALFCVLMGPDHVFEFVNSRYKEVSGGIDLKGKKFSEAFPELENEGYKKILDKVYKTGIPFEGKEMRATHFPGSKNNEGLYVDLSCQPFRDDNGEVAGLLFFSYEVTEQVNNRMKVERNSEELEGKVTERTSLLQAANAALAQSNKNLQEFASIASHDLQEPLRKIKTFTSILHDRYTENLPENAKELISKTQESANRMAALIKDVLNYSRIIVPENSFVQTNLDTVVRNVTGDFDLLAEEKKAIVNVQAGLPVIEAIPLQMNQLFYNIIGNALKFSSKERKPVVNISWKELGKKDIEAYPDLAQGKNYYAFIISDNGIGFEQQFSEQIFSIFERLNTANDYEGTGIGLALCRKIVHNHHGVIRAESIENKGSSFFIILPSKQ